MKLGIVVSTYSQAKGQLQTLVYSLVCQTDQDFKCYVVYDGPPDEETLLFMQEICLKYNNFVFMNLPKKSNFDWGHESRTYGLEQMKEQYVTFTNGDNVYFKDYVKYVNEAIEQNPDIITTDIVHDYFSYSRFGEGVLGWYLTDFMNFVVKTDIAKKIGLRITTNEADSHFAEDFKKLYPKAHNIYIDAILGVHQ